ncbi:MAG: hypothetical protein M3Y28_01870 [Armatimonadota bacterium]|nr:hypothetical protein [Armatimonadota bacterium]
MAKLLQGKGGSGVAEAPIPSQALSGALLVCSAAWLAAACVYAATSAFKNDWSATPSFWMLLVMVTPPVCFTFGGLLLKTRPRAQFSWVDRFALAAAFFPVTVGTLLTFWIVKVLFSMCGLAK